MIVAVATQAEGFTSLTGMIPAFAFHAVTSVAGLQLLLIAEKRRDAERSAEMPIESDAGAGPAVPVH